MTTPEQFAAEMQKISREISDSEGTHKAMDDLMCKTLLELGYNKGVMVFINEDKWYS